MCITGNGLKTTDALVGQYELPQPVRPRLTDFEAYLDRESLTPAAELEVLSLTA